MLLLAACDHPMFRGSYENEPASEPELLPKVSFASGEVSERRQEVCVGCTPIPSIDVWDTVGTVTLVVNVEPMAPTDLVINIAPTDYTTYVTNVPSTIVAPKGSTEVSFTVTIPEHDATVANPVIRITNGNYTRESLWSIHLAIWGSKWFESFYPSYNDTRCSYMTLRPLIEKVSNTGTLCATGSHHVSQKFLDKVSRISSIMLQHRQDLVENMMTVHPLPDEPPILDIIGSISPVIFVYQESWCSELPEIVVHVYCQREGLFFEPAGIYLYWNGAIICPEDDFSTCVHEIAHSVDFSHRLSGGDWQGDYFSKTLQYHFESAEVQYLWDGTYALTDVREFFAEMSSIYFCVPTGYTTARNGQEVRCADELRRYDPKTYEIIHSVYRGSADLR